MVKEKIQLKDCEQLGISVFAWFILTFLKLLAAVFL